MAKMMDKQIDEAQRPTYAAILKRASPRTTTQSQITTAAVKRVVSGGENESSMIKSVTTFANIERKNGQDVKTVSRTQNETDTQQENGWETVPGNFSPIPRTSFVRSIPMIYPVRPQNITQKSLNRMKAPKLKISQSASMAIEGGAVLQEIRIDVTPSIDDTNSENSHVKNAESFGTLFRNTVVKKLKSVQKIYRKWSKTETDVLPKYMPTEEIERNSPISVAQKRQIGFRVLFAIGFILFAVFGAIFLTQILQRDNQGSRHLMADTQNEFKDISWWKPNNKTEMGTFTIKGNTLKFSRSGILNGPIKWERNPTVPFSVKTQSGSFRISGFRRGKKNEEIAIWIPSGTCINTDNFIAALRTKFITNSWYNIKRYPNKGGKPFPGRFELDGDTLTFYKDVGSGTAKWTKTGEVSAKTENSKITISGFTREKKKKKNEIVILENEAGKNFVRDLKARFGDGDGDVGDDVDDGGDGGNSGKSDKTDKTGKSGNSGNSGKSLEDKKDVWRKIGEAAKEKRKNLKSTGSTQQLPKLS